MQSRARPPGTAMLVHGARQVSANPLGGMQEDLLGVRVHLDYDDQNESFANHLPVEGVISKRCSATSGPGDWYLVELDAPFDYQHKAGPHQFKRLSIPRVLIRSRWVAEPISLRTSPSVFLLLVAADQGVPSDLLALDEFIHVCWARCHLRHAA